MYLKFMWITQEWDTSHLWMSHVTHMNETRHTDESIMSHTLMRHVKQMNEWCHTHTWVMSHKWRHHIASAMIFFDVVLTTMLYLDICIHFVPVHELVTTHTHTSHVRTWMSHITHMNESCHAREWVGSHRWMSRVAQMNESCHTHERVILHI